MKKLYFLFLLFFTLVALGQKNPKTTGFIENKGQIVDQKGRENMSVLYLLNTNGLNVQLKKNGFSYDIYETKKVPLTKKEKELHGFSPKSGKEITTPDYSLEYTYHRIDIDFLNSNPNVQLSAEEKSGDYDNYYNVIHAPQGITNVHKFQKVTYQNIYKQIDVVFFIPKDSTKSVEYNFVVKPGGKVSDIQLKFNGAKTELAENKIKMHVRFGEMEETLPLSWEEHGGERKEIAVGYRKIQQDVYGFAGDLNVSGKIIVIDPTPVRLWGTYYGGEHLTYTSKVIKVDHSDNVIFSGLSGSSFSIATAGAFQTISYVAPFETGFIAKLDATGNRIWGTYLNYGYVTTAAINSQNDIYIGGFSHQTIGTNLLATPNSHKEIVDSSDGLLMKFDSNGIRLWGTFYGGTEHERIDCLFLDSNENLIIGGETHSNNGIATPGCFQSIPYGNSSYHMGFFAKFNPQGVRLYGSYFPNVVSHGAIDSNNNIIFGGQQTEISTVHPNISTVGAHQTQLNLIDIYIVKFSPNFIKLWCTYYGGNEQILDFTPGIYSDMIGNIGTDGLNNIYIMGNTSSLNNIATAGTHKPIQTSGATDAFLVKFNANGVRQWGTYYGDSTEKYDYGSNFFVTEEGTIFLIGYTDNLNNIATANSLQPTNNGLYDCYISKFSTSGQLEWGTFYGGDGNDSTTAIFYKDSYIYISGVIRDGSLTELGTSGTFKPISDGFDIFVAKFFDCQSSAEVTSNSPICLGDTVELHATGGTSYTWTGPNSFSSSDPNPTIPNANTAHNGQYICTIIGIGGCDNTVSIDIAIGDTVAPVADVSPLITITGDCTTVVTAPTATDHCAGAITGTTTDSLNYTIPGNYTIHWSYNDGNGNTSTQNQSVVITATPIPTLPSPQDFCVQETATFNDVTITGQNIQWYDALVGGNLLPGTTPMQHLMNYYASQTVNGCESSRATVQINIFSTPAPTGTDQSFCDQLSPTLSDVVVSGTDIRWYATATSTVVLPMTTVLVNGRTYYATQTDGICESVDRLAITITFITTLNAHDHTEEICDDKNDGKETVVLTNYHDDLIADVTGCTFLYYHSSNGAMNQVATDQITAVNYILAAGLNTIYVRITSSNGCHQVVALHLTLLGKPIIPITDIMPICEGSSITIDAGVGYDYYLWSTGETSSSIMVSTSGNYSVTVRENHVLIPYCESIKDFTVVKSNIATVLKVVPIDWTVNQNSITVLLTGNSVGDYEYSLDGIHYQDSNTFTGLESGEYTVYVKDKNGCGIQPEDFYLLMYPKFFTPNGDGYNDVWKIQLSEKEVNLTVKIFDRFGKLLKALDNTTGWDGTFNGQELPSTDYWFTVIRADGKEYRAHFALKR